MDLILVWSGTLVGAVAGIAAQMLIARTLGAEDYGILSSALGLATLAVPLGVFGTAQYWLKVFGEEGWSARCWFRPSLQFLALSTSIIILALALWGAFGPNDGRHQVVIFVLLPVTISLVSIEVVGSKYQLEQRYGPFAAVGAATPILRLLVAASAFFTVFHGDVLMLTAIGYLVASLVIIAVLVPQLHQLWLLRIDLMGHDAEPKGPLPVNGSIGTLLAQSWVFGVAGLLYLAWAQGHVVIAQYALGSHDAGIYNAALVILNAVCLLPTVAFSKFLLPKIHRWAAQDFERLKTFGRAASVSMFGIGIVTAAALYFGAPFAVHLAFGPGFDTAASVLQVLALTIPMRFLGYSAGAMLRTQYFMKIKVAILVVAVVFNLGLAALLLPLWGVVGLAATVSITECLLVSSYVYFMEVHYFRREHG
jgi:O-antigen/teichoic acid export membrane protein